MEEIILLQTDSQNLERLSKNKINVADSDH